MANSHFDEKSGVIESLTPWGRWYQTLLEVVIEVQVEKGTRGKEVAVEIKPSYIYCSVRQKKLFEVRLKRF